MPPLVRDVLEVLIAVAVGGMVWSAVTRIRRGEMAVVRCPSCGRPSSRAYARCPRCGHPRDQAAGGLPGPPGRR